MCTLHIPIWPSGLSIYSDLLGFMFVANLDFSIDSIYLADFKKNSFSALFEPEMKN